MSTPLSTPCTIHAYAKINLILQVAPPVTDPSAPGFGLHPICSWMHAVKISDQITLEKAPDNHTEFDIRWSDGHPVQWDTRSDLMVRAHALLESAVGRSLPIKVTARKTIPAGGGLGGGSSNAASILMGLNDLFELGFDEPTLQSIAFTLGSDIPFFIDLASYRAGMPPKPAVVTGFGDHIQRTPRHSGPLMLLLPEYGCPTGQVYHALDEMGSTRTLDPDRVWRAARTKIISPSELINDLTEPARIAQPRLREAFALLESLQLTAKLSGSGSTLYLLDGQQLSQNRPALHMLHNEFTIHPTELI